MRSQILHRLLYLLPEPCNGFQYVLNGSFTKKMYGYILRVMNQMDPTLNPYPTRFLLRISIKYTREISGIPNGSFDPSIIWIVPV